MLIIPFRTKNASQDVLADLVHDVVARHLSPERALVAIFRRTTGVTTNDMLLAMLAALTGQRELLAANEREINNLTRQVDGLENELRDLLFEIGRLQDELLQFEHQQHSDDDADHHGGEHLGGSGGAHQGAHQDAHHGAHHGGDPAADEHHGARHRLADDDDDDEIGGVHG